MYYVPASIAPFVSLEMFNPVNGMLRMLAAAGIRAMIAVLRMEVIIYVSDKVFRTMEPRADANEAAVHEPFRPIVTVGRAVVGRHVVVTVRTNRGRSNLDTYTNLSIWVWAARSESKASRKYYQHECSHNVTSLCIEHLLCQVAGVTSTA